MRSRPCILWALHLIVATLNFLGPSIASPIDSAPDTPSQTPTPSSSSQSIKTSNITSPESSSLLQDPESIQILCNDIPYQVNLTFKSIGTGETLDIDDYGLLRELNIRLSEGGYSPAKPNPYYLHRRALLTYVPIGQGYGPIISPWDQATCISALYGYLARRRVSPSFVYVLQTEDEEPIAQGKLFVPRSNRVSLGWTNGSAQAGTEAETEAGTEAATLFNGTSVPSGGMTELL